eukprot:5560190-Pyramimonas_sp.AAC.1
MSGIRRGRDGSLLEIWCRRRCVSHVPRESRHNAAQGEQPNTWYRDDYTRRTYRTYRALRCSTGVLRSALRRNPARRWKIPFRLPDCVK